MKDRRRFRQSAPGSAHPLLHSSRRALIGVKAKRTSPVRIEMFKQERRKDRARVSAVSRGWVGDRSKPALASGSALFPARGRRADSDAAPVGNGLSRMKHHLISGL